MATSTGGTVAKDDHVTWRQVRQPGRERYPEKLSDEQLLAELERLHATRHETFLHGTTQALVDHSERQHAVEDEYLRRHPDRDVDPALLARPQPRRAGGSHSPEKSGRQPQERSSSVSGSPRQ